MKKTFTALAAAAACTLACAAAAQSYPARPVKILVGFAAGGPTDVIARLVAQDMTGSLGQSRRRRWRDPRPTVTRCSSPRSRSW